jgi:hypothetical protein
MEVTVQLGEKTALEVRRGRHSHFPKVKSKGEQELLPLAINPLRGLGLSVQGLHSALHHWARYKPYQEDT